LRPIRQEDNPLRGLLRTPDDTGGPPIAQPWLVEAPDSHRFPEQLPPLPASGGQGSAAGGAIGAASGGQGASAAAATASAGVRGQGESVGSGAGTDASTKRSRTAQHCVQCGHKKRAGAYSKYHPQFLSPSQSKCTVPESLWRVAVNPNKQNAIRKFGGACPCTGDVEHPGGCQT